MTRGFRVLNTNVRAVDSTSRAKSPILILLGVRKVCFVNVKYDKERLRM